MPALYDLEDRHPGVCLGAQRPAIRQRAFEDGEDALAHRGVVGVADGSPGRSDACRPASETAGPGCVVHALVAAMEDVRRCALNDRHGHRVAHELGL
ncbi:MAG: hypothetical protein AAGC81_17600 [Pseudomonadota bacterium]